MSADVQIFQNLLMSSSPAGPSHASDSMASNSQQQQQQQLLKAMPSADSISLSSASTDTEGESLDEDSQSDDDLDQGVGCPDGEDDLRSRSPSAPKNMFGTMSSSASGRGVGGHSPQHRNQHSGHKPHRLLSHQSSTDGRRSHQRTADAEGDLLLHSLESDPRYGPSVQKYISKYLDENTMIHLSKNQKESTSPGATITSAGLTRSQLSSGSTLQLDARSFTNAGSGSSGANSGSSSGGIVGHPSNNSHNGNNGNYNNGTNGAHHLFLGRTIKAATRYIDAQGKKAGASARFNSQSMINLSSTEDRFKSLSTPHSPGLTTPVDRRTGGVSPSAMDSMAAGSQNHSSEEVSQADSCLSLHQQTTTSGRTATLPASATGIRSIIESQLMQEKEVLNTTVHRNQDAGHEGRKRKTKRKNLHKLRIQEQLEGQNATADQDNGSGSSSAGTDGVKNTIPGTTGQTGVSIEVKSQFSCLPSRPVFQPTSLTDDRSIPTSNSIKSLCLQTPDCPLERIQFYRHVLQIVRKGKKGLNGGSSNFSVNNASSLQAGGFIELVFKQELRDLIWLEIQGYMDNRSMIEEDAFLCSQRKQIPTVLQKVLKFSVVHQGRSTGCGVAGCGRQAVVTTTSSSSTTTCPAAASVPAAGTAAPEPMCTTPRSSPITIQSEGTSVQTKKSSAADQDVGAVVPASSYETQNTDLRLLIDCDKLAASVALKLGLKDSTDGSLHHRRNTLSSDAGGEAADMGSVAASESQSSATESQASQPQAGGAASVALGCLSPSAAEDENDCCCSETLSRLCQSCVEKENEALDQVDQMVNELKSIERLYPCTKALAYDFPAYASEEVNNRIKTMYLYVNITRDMRQKINLLAKLFQITDRSSAGWPDFDRRDNRSESGDEDRLPVDPEATPEVRTQDIYGYSYKLSAEATMPAAIREGDVRFKQTASSISSAATISAPDSPDVASGKGSPSPSVPPGKQEQQQNIFFAQKPVVSIYRKYVDKSLKHRGLRNLYHQLSHILRPLLYRVHAALKKPSSLRYAEAQLTSQAGTSASGAASGPWVTGVTGGGTKPQWKKPLPISREYVEDLSLHGVWSTAYQEMGLPTFHRPFLFLLRVTLDVIHECLRLRLEQQPEQASAVSVSQLIRECKEVIKAGVQIRQRYVNLAQTVLGEGGTDAIEAQLDTFDDDLKTMLQVYLKYLEQYMFFMRQISSQTSSTSRQKGYLEDEWGFVRNFCVHIPDGEQMAANRFCRMSSDLLISIGDYLSKGITDCFASFNESLTCTDMYSFRKGILRSCRNFKAVFHEASGRACQATAFAKGLRKDLEFAAEFNLCSSLDDLLVQLRESGHMRIFSPSCANYLMFVPNFMQVSESSIWQLVDLTCGGRGVESDSGSSGAGYLLVMACPPDRETLLTMPWTGATMVLEPTVESSISLSHVQVDGLLFVTNQPSNLESQCRTFEQVMQGKVSLHKQPTSCNRIIAQALTDLKVEALDVQDKISHSLNLIYEQVDIARSPAIQVYDANSLHSRCLDICHLGFKLAFEYEKSLTRLITGDLRTRLSKQLVTLALQWIKFVTNKCEFGFRTRWSNQGLEYLVVALEPQYLVDLEDSDYRFLRSETEKFLQFIQSYSDLKSQPPVSLKSSLAHSPVLANPTLIHRPLASSLNFQRSQSVSSVKGMFGLQQQLQPQTQAESGTRLEEWASRRNSSSRHLKNIKEQQESVAEQQLTTSSADTKPMARSVAAIAKLEDSRRQALQEAGVIGEVSSLVPQRAPLQITARKVTFPWQRGFKIGEGRFGKVYTAVNNATGELIAMKEINLTTNDHRAIKETMDEIRTFEGIKHRNLVRYFGIEVHRSDLYIFMEFCNEGTLESAVQLQLPEQLVRKYTKQLLEAVNVLHENGIVHRDIKSANIFLTSDGNLKLGDFGCCMKLANQTTMCGEFQAFVGTPAYMAPEIFTRCNNGLSQGHGRAADIWSIGCVVLEMLTGRRPWHDLENSYQIMFKVGMGESPDIPPDLNEEGLSFVSRCLIHDPRLRPSTGQLLCHPFTKVLDEDDDDAL